MTNFEETLLAETVEIDEEALARVNAQEVFNDLPDLHLHSGENFGKPTLTGE